MANFLLIIDPDAARRESVAARAGAEIAFLPQLARGKEQSDDAALIWAAAPSAPLSHHRGKNGELCHVFGEPLDESGHGLDAAALASTWHADSGQPSTSNGFYAAIYRGPRRAWRIEADALGLFPIYYWHSADVLLAGSSAALFRLHPLFRPQLDLHGVAALLLTSGLVAGRTLDTGVRRLEPDHVLHYVAGQPPRERQPPCASTLFAPDSIAACADEMARLHTRFLRGALVRSHAPGLLLSGGPSSTLLAGFSTLVDRHPHCITFGAMDDVEAQSAREISAALGLSQTLHDLEPIDYPDYLEHSVRWEKLSGGLHAMPLGWNLAASDTARMVDRIVCGLSLGDLIRGRDPAASSPRASAFDELPVSALGFSHEELDTLVCDPALKTACSDVRAAVLDWRREAANDDRVRAWKSNLAYAGRFAMGGCAWRYSFYAWPVLPALDRRVIALAAELPFEISGVEVQRTMLATFFPDLAALVIPQNGVTASQIAPAKHAVAAWRERLARAARRVGAFFGDGSFYLRAMEFNSPGWRRVRAISESERGDLRGLCDLRALARLLPGPRATANRRADSVTGAAPLKNTVGLMHWLHQHA